MFTGIITHLGTVKKITDYSLEVKADKNLLSKINKGSSVSINGICLTVISKDKEAFKINFMPETARHTNIKTLQPKDLVNLELPATPNTFLAGHIVQGHIDGVVTLLDIKTAGNSHILKFSIPPFLGIYLVKKGSVALNGISLTALETDKRSFSVGIIPYTLENTMLKSVKVGDFLNLEVDVLAKYAEKICANNNSL